MNRPLSRRRPIAKHVALALLLAAGAPGLARALPEEAAAEWQKRKVVLTYVPPRVGKHTLGELQVGSTWRLGAGGITTMTFDTAVITSEGIVAPGSYRVNLARTAAQEFALTVEGAGTWSAAGGADITSPGKFVEAKKPNEKLEIVCAAVKEQPDPELKSFELEIQFGVPVVTVPLTLVGTQTLAAKGFAVDAFKLPSEALEKRLKAGKKSPIVSLVRKGKPKEGESARLNLLLGENDVTLLPASMPPTENRGFGAIPTPDRAQTTNGKVQWSEATPPSPNLKVESATIEDNVLHVTILVGARKGVIEVPTVKPKS